MIKCLVDIYIVFSRGLEKLNPELICKGFTLFSSNAPVRPVTFVSNQDLSYAFTSMHFDLLHPVPDVCEAILVGTIVCEDNSHCAFIICGRNSSETFLSCCIPLSKSYNLQFDVLALHFDVLNFKIDSNCRQMRRCKVVLSEP